MLIALPALLCACSQGGRPASGGGVPLLSQIVAEPVLTEEALDRLKAIADAPSSHLPRDPAMLSGAGEGGEDGRPGPELAAAPGAEGGSGGPASASEVSPALAWRRDGFEPRSVAIGDVFSEHAGPVLNKAFSFADFLPAEQWQALAADLADTRVARAPLTMTARDVAEMRARLVDPSIPFPTRSVAIDLRTETLVAKTDRLGELYRRLGEGDASFPENLRRSLQRARARLEGGERLFVVTAVTRSLSTRANYPGAPIGQRDVEAIRNAVQLAYPHLDGLDAERDGNAVFIRRDPDLYWEFDTRELALGSGGFEIRPLSAE